MSQIFPNTTALRNQFPTMDLTPTLTPMHQYGKSVQGNAYMEMYTGHTFVEESSIEDTDMGRIPVRHTINRLNKNMEKSSILNTTDLLNPILPCIEHFVIETGIFYEKDFVENFPKSFLIAGTLVQYQHFHA